jgi:prepilin-type N-terminal cleavage/methylation domain-containing protein
MTDTNRIAGRDREAGFTMIEIVVVLVLATVLATVAVSGSMNVWNEYRLRTAAQTLAGKVKEARTQALKRSRNVWVLLDSADDSMQVQTMGPAGVVNIGGREFLSRNVRFQGFGGTRTVTFDLMGRPTFAPDFVMVTVGPGVTRQVNVNQAGQVTVQ